MLTGELSCCISTLNEEQLAQLAECRDSEEARILFNLFGYSLDEEHLEAVQRGLRKQNQHENDTNVLSIDQLDQVAGGAHVFIYVNQNSKHKDLHGHRFVCTSAVENHSNQHGAARTEVSSEADAILEEEEDEIFDEKSKGISFVDFANELTEHTDASKHDQNREEASHQENLNERAPLLEDRQEESKAENERHLKRYDYNSIQKEIESAAKELLKNKHITVTRDIVDSRNIVMRLPVYEQDGARTVENPSLAQYIYVRTADFVKVYDNLARKAQNVEQPIFEVWTEGHDSERIKLSHEAAALYFLVIANNHNVSLCVEREAQVGERRDVDYVRGVTPFHSLTSDQQIYYNTEEVREEDRDFEVGGTTITAIDRISELFSRNISGPHTVHDVYSENYLAELEDEERVAVKENLKEQCPGKPYELIHTQKRVRRRKYVADACLAVAGLLFVCSGILVYSIPFVTAIYLCIATFTSILAAALSRCELQIHHHRFITLHNQAMGMSRILPDEYLRSHGAVEKENTDDLEGIKNTLEGECAPLSYFGLSSGSGGKKAKEG